VSRVLAARWVRFAGSAAALAAVVALALLGAYVLSPRQDVPPLPSPQDGLSVSAEVTPQEARFGDQITASVLVVADAARIDPRRLGVTPSFTPFTVDHTATERRSTGSTYVLRTTWTLTCLATDCLPGSAGHAFTLAPAEVSYGLRRDGLRRAITVPFAPVRLSTRLANDATTEPRFRVPRPVLTEPRYRIGPGFLGTLLLTGGTAFCLTALLLAFLALRSRLGLERRDPEPLDLVLRELREAVRSNGDSGRRRRALERLAELVEPHDGTLGSETRTLAWAPDDPPADAIDELARRARDLEGR
jgi:hypothetical protein